MSYSHAGPSSANSPVHAPPFVPMYPSPHGTHASLPNPMGDRQRQILELTSHRRQMFIPQLPINGHDSRTGYSNHPTPDPFQSQNAPQQVPQLPPVDGLSKTQRKAYDLIIQLDGDKKVVLKARMETAAKLKRLVSEKDNLEATQRGMEYLRYIYPLQAEIANVQGFHDAYGREWDKVEELLEICWAELMVPRAG
ncbi:MAG: hypothetical protein Q9209_004385 [Squamulea sp. 1 TL-2023]